METQKTVPHILIIEEERDTCSFLAHALCRAHFAVTEVPNLGAASSAIGLWTPHAVVVSLRTCMASLGVSAVGGKNVPSAELASDSCSMPCSSSNASLSNAGSQNCRRYFIKQMLQFIPDYVPVLLLVDILNFELLQNVDDEKIFTYITEPINSIDFIKKIRRACDYRNVCDERDTLAKDLQWSTAHTESVFRSASDILISVNAQGLVVRMNDAGLNALQLDRAYVKERPWQEVLQAWHGQFDDVLVHAFTSRENLTRQRVILRLDGGEERDFEISATPFKGEYDEHLGAVVSIRDITCFVRIGRSNLPSYAPNKYGLVGHSAAMGRVEHLLRDLAPTDTTVLISGESGTGKELVAEALHNAGPRATGPLVKVNCSALPETLLESELFGHVRGAFTGAVRDRVGRFQLAHGGTIFLDEIGEISPQVQLRLLRVLQEREFERVGDTRTTRVNVRVIAATNSHLRQLVAQGRFREDLYYRLRVVEVGLPPLRERVEDIMLLANHFIAVFNEEFSRSVIRFSESARACLLQYRWPGNVRELRHAVEHGFIFCKNNIIDVKDLPNDLQAKVMQHGSGMQSTVDSEGVASICRLVLNEAILRDALVRTKGNKAKAARVLGISRQTLYRKVTEFGLE